MKSKYYHLAKAKDPEGFKEKRKAYLSLPRVKAVRAAYASKWKKRNRDRINATLRKHYYKVRHKLLPRMREAWFTKRYGLTSTEADIELKKPCGICGTMERKRYVDHDHSISQPHFRGVLCLTCNLTLGRVENVGIDKFVDYLTKRV